MSRLTTYAMFFVFRPISDNDSTVWHEFQTWYMGLSEFPKFQELTDEVLSLYAGFYLQFPKLFPKKKKKIGKRTKKDDSKELCMSPARDSVSAISIPMKYVHEFVPVAINVARSLGVSVIDPNTGYIHRVDGFEGIRMTIESFPDFISPNFEQICDAVDTLTFDGGPSFMILGKADQSYTQTAGGDGNYTCEWRQYAGDSFKHWVAGRSASKEGEVSIKTNGSQLLVNSDERLSANDVKQIFGAFVRQEPRPKVWKWRNISDQFQ